MKTAEEAVKELRENDVKVLNVCMVDLLGRMRCVSFTVKNISEEDLENGLGFDGSSITGYTTINNSDLVAKPDLDTLIINPFGNGERVAYVLSRVLNPYTGEKLSTDPRTVLQNVIRMFRDKFKFFVSPELEFFLLDIKGNGETGVPSFGSREMDAGTGYHTKFKDGYFSPPPMDKTFSYRVELIETLKMNGIEVIKSHHEVASAGQIEINFKHQEPIVMADWFTYTKYIARGVAERHGFKATFMPKIFEKDNGSGLHIHISAWDAGGERNLFYDPNDEYAEISETARYFIGGILHHAKALSAILAPTVNSYKRLVPGYEAPVYIAWSRSNRSALIRIPFYKKRDAKGKRIEIRFPDPLTNIYLAFSSIIACGVHGIERKMDPGEPLDVDLYSVDPKLRSEIESLPRDLWEALDYLEEDEVLKKTLGEELIEKYLQLKRWEFKEYSMKVTPWEYEQYFNL